MTLPTITNKQQEIIRILYRHRFLDRKQIQTLLHHKAKMRIIFWLKDLREKQYIDWIYDGNDFAKKTKPAIYFLGLNGIRSLRQTGRIPASELRKRYKDRKRSEDFINRCLLVADCCLNMDSRKTESTIYSYETEPEYTVETSQYHFLSELRPHLVAIKRDDTAATNYLLEIIDASLPRYRFRKRITQYLEFVAEDGWEIEHDSRPIILVACPNKYELLYAKRRAKFLLDDAFDDDPDIHIRFAQSRDVKAKGMTSPIWEEV